MSDISGNGIVMRYFVLKPKGNSPYHEASRAALRAYADSIQPVNDRLAIQIRQWARRENRIARMTREDPTVREEGERFALPFWADDKTWTFVRLRNEARIGGSFVMYLLHIPSGLEAHTNQQLSPYKACVELREMIDKQREKANVERHCDTEKPGTDL